jgi:maleylpyruvate isomerase
MTQSSGAHPLDTEFNWTLQQLDRASEHYLATVSNLSEHTLAQQSVLPGWSVAHVISHVASNATGIERALRAAIVENGLPWVYETNESRDSEIDIRANWPTEQLLTLNTQSVPAVRAAFVDCPVNKYEVLLPRVIDGPAWSVLDWLGARWREVEIHHTDLGVGYTHHDWSDDFVAYLTKVAVFDRDPEISLTLKVPEGVFPIGGGGQEISGSSRAVIWWLIGRGNGEGVQGELPTLGPWQRRTRA